jgi:hypothetical protein
MMELELAQWCIIRLFKLLKEYTTNVSDDQKENVETVTTFASAVDNSLCWG